MIPFTRPTISKKDLENVLNCMVRDDVGEGEQTRKFEKKFSRFIGVKNTLMLNSVSSALYLIFRNIELQPGDEVIISTYADPYILEIITLFQASPVFVDVSEKSYLMNLTAVKNLVSAKTRAVIFTHMLGYPLRLKENWASSKELVIIEDCTHSLGTTVDNQQTGLYGDYAIFSFSFDSIITSGQGGALIARQKNEFKKLRDMRSSRGKDDIKGRLDFSISDLQSAMAVSELSLLPKFLKRRSEIGRHYQDCILKSNNIFWSFRDDVAFNFFAFPIQVNSSLKIVMEMFRKYKIEIKQPVVKPLHSFYGLDDEKFPNTKNLLMKTVCIPIYPVLSKKEIEKIGKLLQTIR
ncbi:MAG TPA: DegT/DnrJ/EryC1/StrS aminotransferase family protein [Spirochaetota bacterium]|nr:DegT/DnrJ/EryC1/StrS aminotransferase family protein [Spirochaetota bacterium]